jgi:hypothetical protein
VSAALPVWLHAACDHVREGRGLAECKAITARFLMLSYHSALLLPPPPSPLLLLPQAQTPARPAAPAPPPRSHVLSCGARRSAGGRPSGQLSMPAGPTTTPVLMLLVMLTSSWLQPHWVTSSSRVTLDSCCQR